MKVEKAEKRDFPRKGIIMEAKMEEESEEQMHAQLLNNGHNAGKGSFIKKFNSDLDHG